MAVEILTEAGKAIVKIQRGDSHDGQGDYGARERE